MERIELNDGSAGLDLTFPHYGRNNKNQLEYHGRGENTMTQSTEIAVMDFDTNVYNCDIKDSAGLGGVSPMRVGSHCSDDGKTFFVTLTRQ